VIELQDFLRQDYKRARANQDWLLTMNKIVEGIAVFFGVCMIILGAIFIVAGSLDTVLTGLALILIAVVVLYFVYRVAKIEAAKPTLLSQTFNVKMEGSGTMAQKDMKCKNCGAPIVDRDLTVIEGGIMAKCSYCGAVFALEEAPKW